MAIIALNHLLYLSPYFTPKPNCMQKIKLLLMGALFTVASLLADAQATFPANDVASPKDGCYAFTNASIVKDAQNTLQNATLVIRRGS